jgi:hypothetical protein
MHQYGVLQVRCSASIVPRWHIILGGFGDLGAWILHSGLCPRPIDVLCITAMSPESKRDLEPWESIYDVSKLVTDPPRSLSHRDLERRGRGRSGPPPEAKVLPTEHALSPKRKDTYKSA